MKSTGKVPAKIPAFLGKPELPELLHTFSKSTYNPWKILRTNIYLFDRDFKSTSFKLLCIDFCRFVCLEASFKSIFSHSNRSPTGVQR